MDSDQSVLLLNSTFEPLTVLKARRALKLLFSKKAYVVEHSGQYLSTIKKKIQLPAVIQLMYYVKKPYKKPKFTKKSIFIRDNYTCQYCKTETPHPTLDHIIPKSKRGETSWKNVVTACHKCNNSKGNQTLKEAGFKLAREPKEPKFIVRCGIKKPKHVIKWDKYFNPKQQQEIYSNNTQLTAVLEEAY